MNQRQAKDILRGAGMTWKQIHADLDTPTGSDYSMQNWAMDRIRWIANGGTMEGYPASMPIQPAASATAGSVGAGNGIGDRCSGCGKPVIDYDQWEAGDVGCNKDGDCPITSGSIRREVSAAVLPLVDAMESLLDYSDYKNRETARKLCREAREKWGTK